jgi:periplasmic protein TonB
MRQASASPDVFTAHDIARAARVPEAQVEGLLLNGLIRTIDGRHIAYPEALRVLRAIVAGSRVEAPEPIAPERLRLTIANAGRREAALPIAISSSVHGVLLGALLLMAMVGVGETRSEPTRSEELPARLVFLAIPGPGGGGGGGGSKQPKPPARAERKGENHLSSPVPELAPPAPVEPPPDPPPPPPEKPPEPIVAPVASVPSDKNERAGVVEDVPNTAESQGPGEGGGAGTGTGVGLGQGNGAGIGQGETAGTGGGAYRPGSDIDPPSILHEVKPDYTEEARRKGLEGDVVMEIVVRSNGSVGNVRVLQGLGLGLDQRAIDAVRQWRFSPAKRRGQVVDVLVEVSVEFRLR